MRLGRLQAHCTVLEKPRFGGALLLWAGSHGAKIPTSPDRNCNQLEIAYQPLRRVDPKPPLFGL